MTRTRNCPLAGACTEYQTVFNALGVIQQDGTAGSPDPPEQLFAPLYGIPKIKGVALQGKSLVAPAPKEVKAILY